MAREAGLRWVEASALTVERRRRGRGFVYVDGKGRRIRDRARLAHYRSLAVPPAYEDVRLAADPNAHLQATGRDEAGRLQYRYHPDWEQVREAGKVERLGTLGAALPRIRSRVARDLRRPGADKQRVLAGVVTLIDRTHIRIGCEDYVHTGRSRGAATLLKRNVRRDDDAVTLMFRGKGGREEGCSVTAPALARLIADLEKLRGRRLFQYRDEAGRIHRITATETNLYLRQIAGAPVTAKDFRTLAATAAAAERLAGLEPAASEAGRRRQLASVFRDIAVMLGNTPAVTRKSYVHRRLVDAFHSGALRDGWDGAARKRGVTAGEALVARLFAADEGGGGTG